MDRRLRLAVGLLMVAAVSVACTAERRKAGGTVPTESTTSTPTTTTVPPQRGGRLVYAADEGPTGFNVNTKAAHNAVTAALMDQVWPSVFHVGPDLTAVLDKNFMTSATLTSQEPETVVLKINPAASWSDGVPITVDDFVYFWQQQRDPEHTTDRCNAPSCTTNGTAIDDFTTGAGYRDIKSVTGSDGGKTVTVVFAQPYGDWKSLWSTIVPAHLAQKYGWNHGFDTVDPTVLVAGGPFKVYSYQQGVQVTLVPNDRYWATPPSLDSIVVHVLADPAQQLAALQSGQADMLYRVASSDAFNAVKAMPDIHLETGAGDQLEQLDFNLTTPGLDDVAVRKAIATAIDRPSISDATVGQFAAATSLPNNRLYLSDQSQYADASGGLYDRGDVAKAKQMLEADGYRLGSDGIYAKGAVKLSFRLAGPVGGTLGHQAAALMQTQLSQAGIAARLDPAAAPAVLGAAQPGQSFDLAIVATVISPFPSRNIPLYLDLGGTPGVAGDAVLGQYLGYGYGEVEERRQPTFYNGADAIMWQNLWTLPLYREPTLLAVRRTFLNVHDTAAPEGPFWNAPTWGLGPLPAGS